MITPPEIIDHIMGFLHSDQDYTTLKKSSVVFPQIVDRLLYSQIGFAWGSSESYLLVPIITLFDKEVYTVRPDDFSCTLINRPQIANYVRVAVLHINSDPTTSFIANVSSILPMLRHLESISLCVDGFRDWNHEDSKFRIVFRNCIQLPSIKEIAIINVYNFSLDAFYDCKNLQNLILYGGFVGGIGTLTSSYPHLQLCSLSVNSYTDPTRIVSWINTMKCNTINTLCLRIGRRSNDLLLSIPIIQACSNTLVNLEVDLTRFHCESSIFHFFNKIVFACHKGFGLSHPDFPPKLRLSLLDHIILRSLLVVKGVEADFAFLVSLLLFFKSVQHPSPIRLTLHFHLLFAIGPSTSLLDLDWSNIVAILNLPMFRHPIELHISQVTPPRQPLADLVSSFEHHSDMKNLLEEGKLAVIGEEWDSS